MNSHQLTSSSSNLAQFQTLNDSKEAIQLQHFKKERLRCQQEPKNTLIQGKIEQKR